MKKTSNSIFKGFLLVTIVIGLSSCIKTENVKWGLIKGVSVKRINLGGVELEATIPIENRNGSSLQIKQGDMTVSADASAIARVRQVNDIFLPGNSNADYKVNIDIDLVDKGNLLSLMNLMKSNTSINIDGTIKAKSFIFQKNIQVHQTNIQDYLKPILGKMNLF